MPLVGKVIGPCLGLGVSTFVMIATESILSISFNSSLARYGGDIAVGAMTIITSATQLLSMPVQGLCQGAQPIMSFNFGAGKGDRVKQAFRLQFIICVAYAAAFWAACMLVPQMFASIFSTDPELVRYTAWAMRVYMAGIFSTGFQVSCQQSFVALGQAQDQSVHGLPAQADFADSPDLYPAPDFAGQGFCCLFGRAGQRYHRGNRNLQRILYPL